MPRPEKVQAVADIKERIENAKAVFLAEYAGLSVAQQQRLRRELKANGAEFKVVKMTLARRAAAELDIDTLDEHLLGPTGLAIADGDAVAAAKVLKDFSSANEVFTLKGGLLGLDYLSPERISELAEIEPRDVLLAKLAGLFAAPMSNTAGLISALQRDVVGLVQALVGKREEQGEVVEPAADAAPAEEAEDASEAAEGEASVGADPEASADDAPAEEVAEVADDAPEAAEDEASSDADPEAVAETEPEASADDASAEEAEPAASDGDAVDETENTESSEEDDAGDSLSENEGDAEAEEE